MKSKIASPVWLAFLFWNVSAASLGTEGNRPRVYVLTVLQVHSASEFTCRVDEWKGIKNLKLRVKARGLERLREEGAQEGLRSLLCGSKNEFYLKNIEDLGYFRVLADVYAGQLHIADILSSEQQVHSAVKTPQEDFERQELVHSGEAPQPPVRLKRQFDSKEERIPVRPGRLEMGKILLQEADLSSLKEDVSFREALEIVRTSVDPPLPLIVLWNDLIRNLFVDPDHPIGFEIRGKVSLGLALELILSSASPFGQRAVLLPQEEVILVVSPQFALTKMRPHAYDISELTSFGILGDFERGTLSHFGGSGK